MKRVALDSNILVYLEGAWITRGDEAKGKRAGEVVAALRSRAEIVVPVQALGELVVVLRRTGLEFERAREAVQKWSVVATPASSTPEVLANALEIAERHRLQFWDSLIISASIETDCTLLLSEDMQNGFEVRGLTVVNPLLDTPHRALARLLED